MKVLSKSEGDMLLTNAEVMQWLNGQKLNATDAEHRAAGRIPPAANVKQVGGEVLQYLRTTPSEAVGKLFKNLDKYKLTDPEKLMIANIRPEAYAHITPLIANIHDRFDDDTIYEILEVVNNIVEARPVLDDEGADTQAAPEGDAHPEEDYGDDEAEEEEETGVLVAETGKKEDKMDVDEQ